MSKHEFTPRLTSGGSNGPKRHRDWARWIVWGVIVVVVHEGLSTYKQLVLQGHPVEANENSRHRRSREPGNTELALRLEAYMAESAR